MSASLVKEIKARPVHRVAQELVDSSGFLLARLGVAFKTQAIARVEEAGYDTYDYSVLAILAEGAREAQATIAGALGLDPGRLVALLDSLEQRGLVTRQRDPQDRRRHVVSITDTGKREHQRLREHHQAARRGVLRALRSVQPPTVSRPAPAARRPPRPGLRVRARGCRAA